MTELTNTVIIKCKTTLLYGKVPFFKPLFPGLIDFDLYFDFHSHY